VLSALSAFALPTPAAFGEGSVDVNAGPGTRTRQGLSTQATMYTVLRVYARAGETIQMGSSAMLNGAANILVFPPGTSFSSATNPAVPATYPTDPVFNTDVLDCATAQAGTGRIATRAAELAGPLPNAGGYLPCQYVAPADGIYAVFMAPANLTANGDPGTVNAPNVAVSQGFTVSIWDVTVRAAGVVQQGRAFTNQAHFRTGATTGSSSNVSAFVYTCTGFLYKVDFFDHAGINWIMAADSQGVIDTATGNLTLASFRFQNSPAQIFPQARAPLMTDPDVVQDERHPVFFHAPDPLTLSGAGGLDDQRGCSPVPVTAASAPLTGVAFTGSGGQAGATNQGSGGTISFTAPAILEGNRYGVALDLDGNGSFADPADVTAEGPTLDAGMNSFVWDGLDGTGAAPGCGTYSYRIQSTLADVHFTQQDVENSAGTQVQRLTLPADPAFPAPLALSYDDVDPYKGVAVTNTSPSAVANGISGPAFHRWTGSTGDNDWVDTWASLPGQVVNATFKVLCADLALVKTASPSPAVPGEPLNYRLVVTNNGPDAATGVTVSDPLPAGLTFVSAGPGCGASGQDVTCALGTIAVGASRTVTVTANVASSVTGQIVNTARVTSATPDPNPGNNASTAAVPLEGETDLSITKTASTRTVGPGWQVLYTLVLENDGPSDATGVTVVDAPPAGIVLRSARASQGSCTVAPDALTCSLGGLVDGGSAQILVTAEVVASVPGALTNAASVSGPQPDPNPANNRDRETVTVPDPPPGPQPPADLTIAKSGASTGAVGRPLEYRIVVRNDGPRVATRVSVTDTLGAPARLVSVRTTKGSCQWSRPITCSLGTIEAGRRVTITVVVKPRVSGTLRNAAGVTGAGADSRTASNLAVVTTRVKPALALTKVTERKRVRAGQTLTYTIRVRNPSDVTLRNIKTCDALPAGLAYVSSKSRAKLSNGRYCWTAGRLGAGEKRTYRLTARAMGGTSGKIVNHATAKARGAAKARAKRAVRVTASIVRAGGVTG
jgi:uncharacterized repeat protein (TIGR01451 family)